MVDAFRMSVLDGLATPRNSFASVAACPSATRLILRGGAEVAAGFAAVFGAELPLRPLQSATNGSRAALWMSPDEWLLLDESADASLRASLEAALALAPHALIDVSHRQGAVEVSGPRAARLLNAGVMLDLDLSAFPVGMVARTLLTKAEIVLWRRAADLFRVEFSRSFGPYVVAILAQTSSDQELC